MFILSNNPTFRQRYITCPRKANLSTLSVLLEHQQSTQNPSLTSLDLSCTLPLCQNCARIHDQVHDPRRGGWRKEPGNEGWAGASLDLHFSISSYRHSFLPHNAEFFEFTTGTLCYRPPCSIATHQSLIELSSNPSNAIYPSLIII